MMIIKLSPQRRDAAQPSVSVTGDTITIDGEPFDFSQIGEGDTLPAEAVGSEYVVGPVERTGGEIVLTLLLPHGATAPEATRFPADIHVTVDGGVALPAYSVATQGDEQ